MAALGNYRWTGLIYSDLPGLNICQSQSLRYSADSYAIKLIFNVPTHAR